MADGLTWALPHQSMTLNQQPTSVVQTTWATPTLPLRCATIGPVTGSASKSSSLDTISTATQPKMNNQSKIKPRLVMTGTSCWYFNRVATNTPVFIFETGDVVRRSRHTLYKVWSCIAQVWLFKVPHRFTESRQFFLEHINLPAWTCLRIYQILKIQDSFFFPSKICFPPLGFRFSHQCCLLLPRNLRLRELWKDGGFPNSGLFGLFSAFLGLGIDGHRRRHRSEAKKKHPFPRHVLLRITVRQP